MNIIKKSLGFALVAGFLCVSILSGSTIVAAAQVPASSMTVGGTNCQVDGRSMFTGASIYTWSFKNVNGKLISIILDGKKIAEDKPTTTNWTFRSHIPLDSDQWKFATAKVNGTNFANGRSVVNWSCKSAKGLKAVAGLNTATYPTVWVSKCVDNGSTIDLEISVKNPNNFAVELPMVVNGNFDQYAFAGAATKTVYSLEEVDASSCSPLLVQADWGGKQVLSQKF